MKPSWKDDPSWANYLAMDEDGEWFWFAVKPKIVDDCTVGNCITISDKSHKVISARLPVRKTGIWLTHQDTGWNQSCNAKIDWKKSLEPRPK